MDNNNYIYDSGQSAESYDNNGIRDCFNPFGNDTEFKDYNSDYRKIVPQIAIKNCELPDIPSETEKRNIRHYFNTVGGFMLIQVVAVNILAVILSMIITMIVVNVDGSQAVSSSYQQIVTAKFNNSSINTALTGFCYLAVNMFIFMVGCKVTKIDKSSLFRTKNLDWKTMCRYIVIAIFLQIFSAMAASMIGSFLNSGFGIDIYGMRNSSPITSSMTKVITTILYTCIIAPILEELVLRGFVLKNLSRVSQRFGIITSALIFALMHDNIPQFILAFLVGIFLGYVAVKHDSILPTIALHMIVNTTNTIFSIIAELNEPVGNIIYTVWTLFFLIFGVIIFILSVALKKDKLPKPVQAQKNRSVPILFTSVGMVSLIAIHLILIFVYMNL